MLQHIAASIPAHHYAHISNEIIINFIANRCARLPQFFTPLYVCLGKGMEIHVWFFHVLFCLKGKGSAVVVDQRTACTVVPIGCTGISIFYKFNFSVFPQLFCTLIYVHWMGTKILNRVWQRGFWYLFDSYPLLWSFLTVQVCNDICWDFNAKIRFHKRHPFMKNSLKMTVIWFYRASHVPFFIEDIFFSNPEIHETYHKP